MDSPAVRVEGLSKTYGLVRALDRVSFGVEAGRGLALVGHNGAGKSTLLEILAGLRAASAGVVEVLGAPAATRPAALRAAVGVVAHRNYLYPRLSAEENLRFFGRLWGVQDLEPRIDRLLADFGLGLRRAEPVTRYSRGMARRIAIARAVLPEPRILLLDEPFDGLDESGVEVVHRILNRLRAGGTAIVVSSHRLEAARPIADRVLVLERGRVALERGLDGIDEGGFADLCRDAILGRR